VAKQTSRKNCGRVVANSGKKKLATKSPHQWACEELSNRNRTGFPHGKNLSPARKHLLGGERLERKKVAMPGEEGVGEKTPNSGLGSRAAMCTRHVPVGFLLTNVGRLRRMSRRNNRKCPSSKRGKQHVPEGGPPKFKKKKLFEKKNCSQGGGVNYTARAVAGGIKIKRRGRGKLLRGSGNRGILLF